MNEYLLIFLIIFVLIQLKYCGFRKKLPSMHSGHLMIEWMKGGIDESLRRSLLYRLANLFRPAGKNVELNISSGRLLNV